MSDDPNMLAAQRIEHCSYEPCRKALPPYPGPEEDTTVLTVQTTGGGKVVLFIGRFCCEEHARRDRFEFDG